MGSKRGDKGRGSIYQRNSDGMWMAQVQVGYHPNGKPKYKQVGRKKHADALVALDEMIAAQRSGRSVDTKAVTVAAYLDQWLEGLDGKKEPATLRYYKMMVERYIKPDIGRIQLRRLTGLDVQRMLDKRSLQPRSKDKEPLSASSVAGIRRTLRAALTRAWKLGLVLENAAQKTDPPKVRKADPVFLTSEEAVKLLDAAKGHCLENIIALALTTGLRIGEATGVRWEDVDLEAKIVRINVQLQRIGSKLQLKELKSASSRRVLPLVGRGLVAVEAEQFRQAKMKAELGEDFANPMGLVFLNEDGRPFDQKYVTNHLKKLCVKAEVKEVSFHKLRHSAASLMVAAGVSLGMVKDQLGHSSIALTLGTYSHMVPDAQREAAEKLDAALKGSG
ncbi:MAG: site-specific integrase [Armatimonadetes bacterium]|nr:site-specific integrase [Armatimonadota bacterium]